MSKGKSNVEKYGSGISTSDHIDNEDKMYTYPRKQSRKSNCIKVDSIFTHRRDDIVKWNGWGYVDSYFYMDGTTFKFAGTRYPLGSIDMPYFYEYVKDVFGIAVESQKPTYGSIPAEYKFQKSRITDKQLKSLKKLQIKISTENGDRLNRSHSQTPIEIYNLINNTVERLSDCVIWPTCHEDVVEIVKICDEQNIVIIPYGGGTNVTNALQCPVDENRTILSLDTSMMNEILWIDEKSLTACCESGIIGQDLERELEKIGYTMGHEPDSVEFSSLGGWVATRASGMKKNTYGNIEDIVVHVRMATPGGVLEKGMRGPRVSSGPDYNHVILGSEGNFGVITEVVIKIRPLPKCSRYGSLIFPDFESGVDCLREIARQKCQPASLRLMDNDQFQLGRSMREEPSYIHSIIDGFSKFYLGKIKGYDFSKISVATIKYEDDEIYVNAQEKRINAIAAQYGGFPSGSANGERGYTMTFSIAYLRDMGYLCALTGDTFETSVPWDKLIPMVENTKVKVKEECQRIGIKKHLVMCRLAQVYDAGACMYFYLIFNSEGLKHPYKVCDDILDVARDAIIESGGSISHHHGVGKIRKKWYPESIGSLGLELFKACKDKMDPNNIFAVSNLTTDIKSNSKKSPL